MTRQERADLTTRRHMAAMNKCFAVGLIVMLAIGLLLFSFNH